MNDNIQVAIRVRHLIDKEKQAGLQSNWSIDGDRIYCNEDSNHGRKPTVYTFDHIFDETSVTWDVFNHTCKQIVDASLNGFNGTIFAYGQSSSGKTHTITGSQLHPGIIPLAVDEIFNQIANIPDREYLIRVSYMEIYNEKLTDLLKDDDTNLKLQEDTDRNVRIVGIHEEMVHNHSVVPEILKKGNNKRHTAATKQNDRSSRSHCILRFVIESRVRGEEDQAVKVSNLYFVDLAGSEKAADNSGDRFREGCSINKSLFTLSNVIRKLSGDDNFQHASYRDSKLTRILQNALGGNSKTAIICTITPAHIEESESTLKFASRAKTIKNEAHINEVVSEAALLKRYLNKIKNLEKQVKEGNDGHLVKKLEENEAYLKEQEETIKNLKKMILISGTVKTDEPPAKKRRRETWAPGKRGKPRLSLPGASSFAQAPFELEDPIIEEEEQPTEMLCLNEEPYVDVKFQIEDETFQNQTIEMNPTVKELFELQDKHELLLEEIQKKDKELEELKEFKELERQMQDETIKELSDIQDQTAEKKVKDWEGSQQWLEEELMKAQQERNSLRQKVESLTRQLKSAEAGVGLSEKCEQLATAENKIQELNSDIDIQKARYEFHIEQMKQKVESYAKMLDEAGVDSDFMKQRLSSETDMEHEIAEVKTAHDVQVNELQNEIDMLVLALEREKKKKEELNEEYLEAFEDQKKRFQKDIEDRDEEIEIYRGMLEEATSHKEEEGSFANPSLGVADKDMKNKLSDYEIKIKHLESELEKYKKIKDEEKKEVLVCDENSSPVQEEEHVDLHTELTTSEVENIKQIYEKEQKCKHVQLETETGREETGELKQIAQEENQTLRQGFTEDGKAEMNTVVAETELQEVRDEYERKIKDMKEYYDDLLKQTDYKNAETSNFSIMEREKLTAEMEEMRCFYEEKIKEMTHENSMEEKAKHDDCMNDLQSELLKAEMEEMKEKYENQIKELKNKYEQIIFDNRIEFDQASSSESSKYKLMEEEMENIKQLYERKCQELSEEINKNTFKVNDVTESCLRNDKRQDTQERDQTIEGSKISDFEGEFNGCYDKRDSERDLLNIASKQSSKGNIENIESDPFIETDKVHAKMEVEDMKVDTFIDIKLNEKLDSQTADSAVMSGLVGREEKDKKYDTVETEIKALKTLNALLDEEVKNLKEKMKQYENDIVIKEVDKTSIEIQTETVAEEVIHVNKIEELHGNDLTSCKACCKDRETFHETCRMYESTIKEIGDELASFKGRLKKLQDEIEQLQDANKSLKNDKIELINEKAELDKNLEVLSETVEKLKESLKESEKEIELLRAVEVENTELWERIEQMEGDSKLSSELISEYEIQVKELTEKLNSEELNDKNYVSEDDVRRMEEDFSEKFESIKSEKERLEDGLQTLEEEKDLEIQALRDQYEKIMESTVNKNEVEERLKSSENEKLELLAKLQERMAKMESDSKLSSELISGYEIQVKELKQKSNSEKENDKNMVSEDDVRRMEEDFSEKFESIKSEKERLEGRLQTLEEEKDLEIQALRDQYEKIMESTVNKNEVEERLKSSENEKLELLLKLQEQDGDRIERQQNLEVLSETVEKLKESQKESEKEIELLRDVEIENTELRERIEQMEGDSKLSTELISEYEIQVQELKEKLKLEKENDKNMVSEDDVRRMEEDFSEKFESIKSEKERFEGRLQTLEEEKDLEIQALRDQYEKNMESTVNKNEVEERLRSLENEKLELLLKLQEQDGDRVERQQTVDLYAEIIEELKGTIKELEKDNSDLNTNYEKIQRDHTVEKEQYMSEISSLQDRLEKLECEHKLNLELIEEYEIEVSKLKEKLLNETVSTVRKEKMEELEKFYSEKLLTIKKDKEDVELSLKGQISKCEHEIEELKLKLSSRPSELNCITQTDKDRLERLEKDNVELKEQIRVLETEKDRAKTMIESLEEDKEMLERNLPPDAIKYHSLPENLDWENKWEDFVREEKKKRREMAFEIRTMKRQISQFDESKRCRLEDSFKILNLMDEVESLKEKLAALEAEKQTGYIANEDHSCKFRQENLKIKAEMDEVKEELEAKKQSFEEVAQSYEQRIKKLKQEIRRLNDLDQTYVGNIKQPNLMEENSKEGTPKEKGSQKSDIYGSSTSGGIVDHFKVCLLEAENKRMKKELEKLKKDLTRSETLKKENNGDSVSMVKEVDQVKPGDRSKTEDSLFMPASVSKQRHVLGDLTRKAPTAKASDVLDVSDKEDCKLDLTSLYKKPDERLRIYKKDLREREPDNCKTN